jgi:hypothetical protein
MVTPPSSALAIVGAFMTRPNASAPAKAGPDGNRLFLRFIRQIKAIAAWLCDLIELGQAVSTMAMQAVAHDFLPVWLLGHATSVIIHKRI